MAGSRFTPLLPLDSNFHWGKSTTNGKNVLK
jgi:hypothetical protein